MSAPVARAVMRLNQLAVKRTARSYQDDYGV